MSNGILYIVATPIGNLDDLTPRAVQVLNHVDLVLCEDTSHSLPLLKNFNINTPTKSYHNYNERERVDEILLLLQSGKNIALISDAGTPLISDPGYHLTKACHDNDIKVSPVPGCCAFVAALAASGLPSDNFTFAGFLPAKSKQRCDEFQKLLSNENTVIYYESSHRILESLEDLAKMVGSDRQVCLAKELTKHFETIKTAPVGQVINFLEQDATRQKGEFVLIVTRSPTEKSTLTPAIQNLLQTLASELPPKVLSKAVCSSFDLDKKEVYDYLLSLKQ